MLKDEIQKEIQDTVPQMIRAEITIHSHNGSDSAEIQGQYLSQAPQATVTVPLTGSVVDTEARTAITDLVSRLQALGLLN